MAKKNGKAKPRPGKATRYLGVDGRFFWNLKSAGNGEIVSDGGQGFDTLSGVNEAFETAKRLMSKAVLVDSPTLQDDLEKAAASRAQIRQAANQAAENATA
ncbi:YegP family protein [Glutamicibacter sp.]|jgi:Domain of unknown function (DUF1508).|uniref:YegP family protein n=1 Tax=Glutamicibacter sp. TaxID=1931995 RepID=UPI002FDB2786